VTHCFFILEVKRCRSIPFFLWLRFLHFSLTWLSTQPWLTIREFSIPFKSSRDFNSKLKPRCLLTMFPLIRWTPLTNSRRFSTAAWLNIGEGWEVRVYFILIKLFCKVIHVTLHFYSLTWFEQTRLYQAPVDSKQFHILCLVGVS
jgi:hypothetical protein